MEDFKTIISPSSPNISASANNENETENRRNSQQANKNFMAPTTSSASKFIQPKKKILAEWKPKDLDSKLEVDKMGTSNSNSNSRNSLPKIPSNSSPKNAVLKSDEKFKEVETFVPDSCTLPYDPLTNYLSPRPKFLRYNPNRKRKLFLQRGNKIGSLRKSVSSDSISQSSCSSECTSEEGNKEIVQKLVVEEKVEEDEEELVEESNWGLKWGFCKSLIVFFVWLFFTMFISSMNSPTNYPDSMRRIKVENQIMDNKTFGFVSLRSLEPRNWVFDEFGADNSAEIKGIESPGKVAGSFEGEKEENQVSEEENYGSKLEYEIDNRDSVLDYTAQIRTFDDFLEIRNWFPDVFPYPIVDEVTTIVGSPQNEGDEVKLLVSGLKSEDGVAENVATIAAPNPNLVIQEEKIDDLAPTPNEDLANEVEIVEEKNKGDYEGDLTDSEEKKDDFVPKSNEDLASEVEIVEEKNKGDYEGDLVDSEEQKDDFVPNSSEDLANDVEIDAEDSSNDIEEKNKGDYENEMAEFEPQLKDVSSEYLEEEENDEDDDTNVSLTHLEFTCIVALSLVTCVVFMVVKSYYKCRKTFSRTSSSRKKIKPLQVEMKRENSIVGLPPKVGEKADQVHYQKTDVFQVNVDQSVGIGEVTPRIVPRVKQLGEFEFSASEVRSGRMQEEASVFSVTDDRKAKRIKGSSSVTSESHSEAKTAKQEDAKEKVSTVRRSKRLQDRGATSP